MVFLHSVERVAHDRDQHVHQHQRNCNRGHYEDALFERRVRVGREVPVIQKKRVHQKVRESSVFETVLESGGGEEQSDGEGGSENEDEEGNHVLHDLNHNAQKHSCALEEREDRERSQALTETEESEEKGLDFLRRGVTDSHSEVEEGEEKSEQIDPVPKLREVGTLLVAQLNGLDEQSPQLETQKRVNVEERAEEGSVKGDGHQPQKNEDALQSEEPE